MTPDEQNGYVYEGDPEEEIAELRCHFCGHRVSDCDCRGCPYCGRRDCLGGCQPDYWAIVNGSGL